MAPPSRKRAAPTETAKTGNVSKRIMTGMALKKESSGSYAVQGAARSEGSGHPLKDRFLAVFVIPEFKSGISNSTLKERFGDADYIKLVPIINELTSQSRLVMSKVGETELFYSLVSEDVASRFHGLDASARMVYQYIERAGNMGIWTKDLRVQTSIQQQALNKIFKTLESRQLIKPVKSVNAKSKKLYMLYDLTPSTELTGGVWYSDMEFDHEFISELRNFLLSCVRRMNGGNGVTLPEVREKMIQGKVSRVQLAINELRQLMQTLVYDYLVDEVETEDETEVMYLQARRVTPMCSFKWWDCLSPDFQYRAIQFEDSVTLAPHEPHYHTA
ncbi:predicted protein [Phaeodactylum tricornutum CCAP 1055/1]|jgi:DNA-directed RNA polymerase III subunit RPC6|uniref:DNA-directed RNA polymerase III subunit RPC6 n=2 Tax=Phaeodactylum tricornutum TaxID=2850 RepID=B7FVQ3_PHATC|nr:predicted protein [Phaeodactylum tricornutum CCAP 1055/1]EEC49444.1 predicted protein [Phaeodactylum tricornutum CCAP 1055/1]|eukprot:XP_002178746.1 predicted protein [Phaeodactylum tricornutum CCAP 1055/1]